MKPKLLIVDDDDEIRTQMKWALAKDYEIVMAADRNQAREEFQTHRPAVVLLDLGAILAPSSFATTVHLLRNMSIDSALLVADRRHSGQSDLSMASELLKENGCQPLGIIENRAA